jgi:hypothetical protein
VHLSSHRELLEAILNGSAKPGNIKLFCSRRGIWYVLISVSLEVPDAEPLDRRGSRTERGRSGGNARWPGCVLESPANSACAPGVCQAQTDAAG